MRLSKFILILIGISFMTACGKDDEGLSYDEQLAVDIEIIDAYLADNNIAAEVHSSGFRYVIHNEGTGGTPNDYDEITVNYEGRFLSSGNVFDSNDDITFQLYSLINAWRFALPLIKEGGSMTIYAPSGLCYGPQGFPQAGIPANANMIFKLDLIEIVE